MLHRVFIALNLPESVKTELLSYQEKWKDLPCRWTRKENLHITLVFYGSASEKELESIEKITKEIAGKHKTFTLKLSKIVYGPRKSQPRMIWAVGESTKEFVGLQSDLATALSRMEKGEYSLHLTLARLKEWEFRGIDPEDRPEINEEVSFEIPVNSIEIMESKLKRGGAEYTQVSSFTLQVS